MPEELTREQEQQGTRRLVLGGAVIAGILLIAFVLWPLLLTNKLGTPPGGANPSTTSDTTKGRGMPAQQSAESTVGKNDPAGPEDATGGRARQIKQSSRSLQLSDSQREQVKQILSTQNPPKIDKANFELMIGAAVPAQAPLQDIPPEVTQVMNGYWGDQYVIVRDTMVIVDQHSRRVVAIVPGAA
jgi:hypothetical protein